MRKRRIVLTGMIAALLIGGCSGQIQEKNEVEGESRDTFYQAETLQSLMLGNYYGFVSVADVKAKGDIGLGTFEAVDGEMIVLDGVVYQAKGDGSVVIADDSTMSPFCSVTWFDEDQKVTLESVTDIEDLKTKLTDCIKDNQNIMYALKMHGQFTSITARSEIAQVEPYKDLSTALETDQRVFPKQENISGTVVAVYFPDYMDGINTPGWHLHFISDDHKFGGHICDIAFDKAEATFDATTEFHMAVPDDENFANLELKTELDDAISQVEGGKE